MGCGSSKHKIEPKLEPEPVLDREWRILWEYHAIWGVERKYASKVVAVFLVYGRGKGPTKFFRNHWSIHLTVPGGASFRLDISGLGKMGVKLLRPVTRTEFLEAELRKDSMYPWVIDVNDQPVVKRYMPTDGGPVVRDFISKIEDVKMDETAKGLGCAEWSANVIDLFIKERLIKPDTEWDTFLVVRQFMATAGEKCRLDHPSGREWLRAFEQTQQQAQVRAQMRAQHKAKHQQAQK